ncbi:MAG: hypothetical protein CMN06_10965 [Roseibacillus sp.]|nr:hypothetical protein [Roseibacillus sp.]|tara:strand:+ start:3067 stop:3588 length:522 start_codon:yes stop_codon:yes gene_type:complete
MTWDEEFTTIFNRCVEIYQSGNADFESYYSQGDLNFLRSIGCKTRELFDFVEDHVDESAPSPTTALLITAVRRDYLHVVQNGQISDHQITREDLPSFGDTLGGIHYLPRILTKARAKLKGELDPDIMYCCGGDRKFLREHAIHPADFLRHVWAADGDDEKILELVRSSSATKG